jgi:histidinol phosphatase-like enzyme
VHIIAGVSQTGRTSARRWTSILICPNHPQRRKRTRRRKRRRRMRKKEIRRLKRKWQRTLKR